MDLYPFKAGPIEPICLPGNIVGLWVSTKFDFRKVVFIEPIPISDPLINNLGALGAGATVGATQLLLLEMPIQEFGQFRSYVIDDVVATLWQPSATARKGTNIRTSRISRFTDLRDPCHHQTEFYVWERNWAFMSILNPTAYATLTSLVAFYGMRYVTEAILDANNQPLYDWSKGKEPPTWTRVPCAAHL